jgi:hypothetical protein
MEFNGAQKLIYTEMCARMRAGVVLAGNDLPMLRKAEEAAYAAVADGGPDLDPTWRQALLHCTDLRIARMNAG